VKREAAIEGKTIKRAAVSDVSRGEIVFSLVEKGAGLLRA